MGKGFSIIADIEAKATLAAITDFKRVEVIVNGQGEEIMTLLQGLFREVSKVATGAKDTDSEEEQFLKELSFLGAFYEAYRNVLKHKYCSEEEEK